jgi:hypothetical protein
MKDVMIDLETFGNGNNAAICQIGACYFDRNTGEIGNTFKVNIDAASAVKLGAAMDASTVYWWLEQSPEARASISAPPRLDIADAMYQLNDFLGNCTRLWSHATFDFVIIMNTFRLLGVKPNFSYRAARDIRTLVDLAKVDTVNAVERTGTHHDGLEDAIHQVKYCVLAMNKLKGKL